MVTLIDARENPQPQPPKGESQLDLSTERVRHPEKRERAESPHLKKPDWIRVRAPTSRGYEETKQIVRERGLFTVCEEAACPNIGECWSQKHATFMVLGDTCTRACAFCNVRTGLPGPLDADEPRKVAESVVLMGLKHVVITSVDRDDLDDGGATFRASRHGNSQGVARNDDRGADPDFLRKDGSENLLIDSGPDVFNHNLETVPRLYLKIRPGARYYHSLRLLERVKARSATQFTNRA